MLVDPVREGDGDEIRPITGRSAGQLEAVRSTVGVDDPADPADRAIERIADRHIGRFPCRRVDAERDRDIRVGRRGVREHAVETRDRHGPRVHRAGRHQGRSEDADETGRSHDRPRCAGAAEAHLHHRGERRDQRQDSGMRRRGAARGAPSIGGRPPGTRPVRAPGGEGSGCSLTASRMRRRRSDPGRRVSDLARVAASAAVPVPPEGLRER